MLSAEQIVRLQDGETRGWHQAAAEAAEKSWFSGEMPEKHTSGAKALLMPLALCGG